MIIRAGRSQTSFCQLRLCVSEKEVTEYYQHITFPAPHTCSPASAGLRKITMRWPSAAAGSLFGRSLFLSASLDRFQAAVPISRPSLKRRRRVHKSLPDENQVLSYLIYMCKQTGYESDICRCVCDVNGQIGCSAALLSVCHWKCDKSIFLWHHDKS